jgi:hypothetical protein
MVALTQIGAEFKIVATAHLKQIDRVINDLTGSASSLREKSNSAITVGFCVFRLKEATHSGPRRPPIPAEGGHPLGRGQAGVISG